MADQDPAANKEGQAQAAPVSPPATPSAPAAATPKTEPEKPPVVETKPEAAPAQKEEPKVVTPPAPPAPPPQVKSDPVVVATPAAPAASPSSESVIVGELLDSYKTILLTRGATPTMIKTASATFANVMARALRDRGDEVFGVIWKFFVDNKDTVCQESVALQGVDSLDNPTRFKVEIFYTLFRKAVLGVDVTNPKLVSIDLVRSRLNCPPLLTYLQKRKAQAG